MVRLKDELLVRADCYVDGAWKPAHSGARYPVKNKATGEVINIACGSRVTIGGLANFVGAILGRDITPKYDKPRDGDVRHSLADIGKAQELLGYRPRVGIEEGLRMVVDWFQKQR